MSQQLKVVHLVTQRNQPYGSCRQCCEICGTMTIGRNAPLWTDDLEQWDDRKLLADHGYIRCDDLRKEEKKAQQILES